MRRKYKKIIYISVMILLVLAYLISTKPSKDSNTTKKSDTVQILIAKKRLMPGYLIRPEDTYWQAKNKNSITPDNITKSKPFATTVKTAVDPNEVLLKSNIEKISQGSTAAARVKQTLAAASISVKKSHLTSILQPGDKINLIFNKTIADQFESTILLKNVLVISKSTTKDTNMHLLLEIPIKTALQLELIQPYGYFSITLNSSYTEKTQHSNQIPIHKITHIDGDHTIKSSILLTQPKE